MINTTHLATEILAMTADGYPPIDCLRHIISEGAEYPDAVYLVTSVLELNDADVLELEDAY